MDAMRDIAIFLLISIVFGLISLVVLFADREGKESKQDEEKPFNEKQDWELDDDDCPFPPKENPKT